MPWLTVYWVLWKHFCLYAHKLQAMHAIMPDDRVAITKYVKLDEDNEFVR